MNRILHISKNIKYNANINRFKANDNKKKLVILNKYNYNNYNNHNNYNKIVRRSYSQQYKNNNSDQKDPKDPMWKIVMILTGIGLLSQYRNKKI